MGCEGCLTTQKELSRQFEKVYEDSKKYAIEIQKMVVIYRQSDGSYQFMEAESARRSGIQPIQFISHLF
jgi:hypothetical protein